MTATRTKTFPRSDAASAADRHSLRVEVLAGPDAGASIVVGARAVVGRGETTDVRLNDPTVSQFHVELTSVTGGARVRDIASHNGTYFGDAMLHDAVVADGAELSVGATRIRITLEAASKVERSNASSFGDLVGFTPAMRELFAVLERLSRTDLSVLVEGEPGSGKETVARAIAAAGPLGGKPVHVVDCATLPRHLAEETFVGQSGALAAAAGQTLLLLNVVDLSLDVQRALVRAFQEGARDRLRVLATSRADVRALLNRGAFHEELYYGIADALVRVPPLAERVEDVKPLIHHFLAQLPFTVPAARAIEQDALDAVAGLTFSTNVRQLRALVERLAKLAEGPTITSADLDFVRLVDVDRPTTVAPSEDSPLEGFKEAKRTLVDEFERAYIDRLLARAGTNISRAAAIAGVDRQSLRSLLRRHGIRADD